MGQYLLKCEQNHQKCKLACITASFTSILIGNINKCGNVTFYWVMWVPAKKVNIYTKFTIPGTFGLKAEAKDFQIKYSYDPENKSIIYMINSIQYPRSIHLNHAPI